MNQTPEPETAKSQSPAAHKLSGQIVIPCDPAEFASFLADMLAKPQVIHKFFIGSFDIEFGHLLSLYHLINHRVVEQNGGQLVQFSATFSYDDQSSVTINNFRDFEHYNEVKHVETLQVTCSFEYLIQFHGRSHPEKQSIDVTFARKSMPSFLEDADSPALVLRRLPLNESAIFLRIKHTARSWGADMEALLSEHIKGLFRKEEGIKKWLGKHSTLIGSLFGGLVFVGGLITIGILTRFFVPQTSDGAALAEKIHDASSAATIGIPYILRNMNPHLSWDYLLPVSLFCVVISVVLAVFSTAVIDENLSKPFPTFLTFTKLDSDRKPIVLRRYRNSRLKALGTAITAVLYGCLGNYIFYLLCVAMGWRA